MLYTSLVRKTQKVLMKFKTVNIHEECYLPGCNTIWSSRRSLTFGGTCCLHFQGWIMSQSSSQWDVDGLPCNSENGGSMFLQNVGEVLLDYMTSHPRRECSSLSHCYKNVRTITNILLHHRLHRKHFTSSLFHLQYRQTPTYEHNVFSEMCL